MGPSDPSAAQQIVAAYAEVLEGAMERGDLPAPLSSLPYPKDAIRSAIRASVLTLIATDQLTSDLRDFLAAAYAGLADFVDDELARLMREFQAAAADARPDASGERLKSESWHTLQRTSPLIARIAQSMADDAEHLRREFESWAPAATDNHS
jgi:hypothetical protein